MYTFYNRLNAQVTAQWEVLGDSKTKGGRNYALIFFDLPIPKYGGIEMVFSQQMDEWLDLNWTVKEIFLDFTYRVPYLGEHSKKRQLGDHSSVVLCQNSDKALDFKYFNAKRANCSHEKASRSRFNLND